MRILLVSPESKTWSSRKHIPLGLGYLGAVLEEEGHHVQLWDGAVEQTSLTNLLDEERFELVGISSTTPLIHDAWEAALEARRRQAITILGGAHPTLLPAESLEQPDVDMVVRGEAEDAIIEIMNGLDKDRGSLDPATGIRRFTSAAWFHIGGLSFRDAKGEIVHNHPRRPREDLDSLPFPAHHLYRIERYTNLQPLTDGLDPEARAYTIITSRGCPEARMMGWPWMSNGPRRYAGCLWKKG
jgi:radical SAM superfamily enzyme YgiQ (UPF0313 family)